MEENVKEEQIFDLTGGLLCLDFANTVDDRTEIHPQELLMSYVDLISWGQQAEVLTEQKAQQLLEHAEQRPSEATRVLKRAIEVREAIFRIFKAVAEGESPEGEDLVRLSAMMAEAQKHAQIVPIANGFRWDWAGKRADLDCVLWPVVRSFTPPVCRQPRDRATATALSTACSPTRALAACPRHHLER